MTIDNIEAALGPLLGSYRFETELPRRFLYRFACVLLLSSLVLSLLVSSPRFFPFLTFTSSAAKALQVLEHQKHDIFSTCHGNSDQARGTRLPPPPDHLPPNRPETFGKRAQIEALALLYRFMPSIPRETLKT